MRSHKRLGLRRHEQAGRPSAGIRGTVALAERKIAANCGSHYWFKMILSTHAVVGAALATLMPSHPVAAVVAGFASHFVIDSIPHWDYRLRSISLKADARNIWRITAALRDLAVIGFDAFAGLVLAVGIFGTKANMVAVLAGAVGGMLPDPLKLVYMLSSPALGHPCTLS